MVFVNVLRFLFSFCFPIAGFIFILTQIHSSSFFFIFLLFAPLCVLKLNFRVESKHFMPSDCGDIFKNYTTCGIFGFHVPFHSTPPRSPLLNLIMKCQHLFPMPFFSKFISIASSSSSSILRVKYCVEHWKEGKVILFNSLTFHSEIPWERQNVETRTELRYAFTQILHQQHKCEFTANSWSYEYLNFSVELFIGTLHKLKFSRGEIVEYNGSHKK